MTSRKQRKARQKRAQQHSRRQESGSRRPSIREAQLEIVRQQAERLTAIGGRFGELLGKATVLPPPAPEPGAQPPEFLLPLNLEERDELMALAPEAREAARLRGIELMANLRAAARPLDVAAAIALASWMNLWMPPGDYYEPTNRGSEAKVELLTGVMVTQEADADAEADAEHYQQVLDLLDEALAHLDLYLWADAFTIAQGDPRQALLRHKTLSRRLHMRGESYIEHAEVLAREVYGPHEAALRKAIGFGAEDLIRFAHAATRVVQEEVNGVMEREMGAFADAVDRGMDAPTEAARQALADEAWSHLHSIHEQLGRAMTFCVEQVLAEDPSLTGDAVDAILTTFSTPLGAHGPEAYSWALDEHPLARHPIVALGGGKYMIPMLSFICRDYLSLLDDAIVGRGILPGDYLADAAERVSLGLMRRVFSDSEVYGPMYYRVHGERCETDGLVLCEGVAIIIEAKARSISLQATRGDTRRLRRDLEDSITEGVRQGARLAEVLRSESPVTFEDEQGKTVLEVSGGHALEVHVLNPQLMPILDLGSQPAILAAAGVEMATRSAVPVFLNDLRMVVECAPTPAEFVAYLRWRANQPLEQLDGFDEGDLLGAFLLNEDFRFLEGRPARLQGYFTTQFDDHYAIGIDAPKGEPQPRKMLPRLVTHFVQSRCESRPDGWLDAACALLDMDMQAYAFIDVKAPQAAADARRVHGVSMLVYGNCALLGLPGGMGWDDAFRLVESELPEDVDRVVFVTDASGRLRIRWALHV